MSSGMLDRVIWARLEQAGIPVEWAPSPNFGERLGVSKPGLVVMHYTALELDATLARLCDPGIEASTHFVIDRSGAVYALVSVEKRAWHAGRSDFRGITDVNSHSVGIDLVFVPDTDIKYSEEQYKTLKLLLAALRKQFRFKAQDVVGHEEVATPAGRKQDPGPAFDWEMVRGWIR